MTNISFTIIYWVRHTCTVEFTTKYKSAFPSFASRRRNGKLQPKDLFQKYIHLTFSLTSFVFFSFACLKWSERYIYWFYLLHFKKSWNPFRDAYRFFCNCLEYNQGNTGFLFLFLSLWAGRIKKKPAILLVSGADVVFPPIPLRVSRIILWTNWQ